MRPLRTFKQQLCPRLIALLTEHGGIGDVVLQPIGIAHILLEHFSSSNLSTLIQPLQKPIDLDQVLFELSAKQRSD